MADAAQLWVKSVEALSLIIAERGQLVAARDPIGVNAALLWRKRSVCGFGFEPKAALEPWLRTKIVSAWTRCRRQRSGFKFTAAKTLSYSEPKAASLEDAAQTLQRLLEGSVERRVCGVRKVAVAFSGGLDSSVVAHLAKKCGVQVELVHVSLENQPETQEALKSADALDLPLQVHLFKESDVEAVLGEVLGLVEKADSLKASIGVRFIGLHRKLLKLA